MSWTQPSSSPSSPIYHPSAVVPRAHYTVNYQTAQEQQLAGERIQILQTRLNAGLEAMQKNKPGSEEWTQAANEYFGSLNEIEGEKKEFEQALAQAQAVQQNGSVEQKNVAEMQQKATWLQEKLDDLEQILDANQTKSQSTTSNKRQTTTQPLKPGQVVVTDFKPTQIEIVTPTEARDAINAIANQAHAVARNDSMYAEAQKDPVGYAAYTLQRKHANEEQWLDQIQQQTGQVRQEYTRTNVQIAMAKNDLKSALQILKTNLDYSDTKEERSAVFASVSNIFTAQYFSAQFDKLPTNNLVTAMSPDLAAEAAGNWIVANVPKGCPPEIANIVYDVANTKYIKNWEQRQQIKNQHNRVGPRFFLSLCALAQAMDVPSNSRQGQSAALASWVCSQLDRTTSLADLQISSAIEQGYSKLPSALVKQMDKDDWQFERNAVLTEICNGLRSGYDEGKKDVENLDNARGSLDFVLSNNANPGDTQKLLQIEYDFRTKFSDQAASIDNATKTLDESAATLALMVPDLTNIVQNPIAADNGSIGYQSLQTQLSTVGEDKALLKAMNASQTLSTALRVQGLILGTGSDSLLAAAQPTAKAARGVRNLISAWVEFTRGATLDSMLHEGLSSKDLTAKFIKNLEAAYSATTQYAQKQGIVDNAKLTEFRALYAREIERLRKLSAGNVSSAHLDGELINIVNDLKTGTKDLLGEEVLKKSLQTINPTDSKVALGRFLYGLAAVAYVVAAAGSINAYAHGDRSLSTKAGAVLYPATLGMLGAQVWVENSAFLASQGSNLTGFSKLLLKTFRVMPAVTALTDVAKGYEDLKAGDYVGAGLDAGIITGAAMISIESIVASAPAFLNPYGLLVLAAFTIARAGWAYVQQRHEADKFEYNNEVVRTLTQDIGYSDGQAKMLLNQTSKGVAPGVAMQQWWAQFHGNETQFSLFDFTRRLKPEELARLIPEIHYLLDKHLDTKTGALPKTSQSDSHAGQMIDITKIVPYGNGGTTREVKEQQLQRSESIAGLEHWMQINGIDFKTVMARQPLAVSNLVPLTPAPAAQAISDAKPSYSLHTVKKHDPIWNDYASNETLAILQRLNPGSFAAA